MNYEIHTARLFLKLPTLDNSKELFALMHQHVDTSFLSWEPHQSVLTTKELVTNLIEAQKQGKGYHWCVFLDNHIVGVVSLIDVRRQIRTWTLNRAELSYWIATPFTGKGYASESAKAVLEFAFKELSFHKIIIAHAEENIVSKRICEKLAFKKYAHEQHAFMKNNKWHNLIWYDTINS